MEGLCVPGWPGVSTGAQAPAAVFRRVRVPAIKGSLSWRESRRNVGPEDRVSPAQDWSARTGWARTWNLSFRSSTGSARCGPFPERPFPG